MKSLYTKNMVQGLQYISFKDRICEGCIFGKQHTVLFPLGPACKARSLLQLIHADLCGPMRTPSLNSSRYFFLIVDDYTRINWVIFFKEKAKAFQKKI